MAQSDNVGNALDSIPSELQGKITQEQLNSTQTQAMKVFKQMCDKNGGSDAFEKVLVSDAPRLVLCALLSGVLIA